MEQKWYVYEHFVRGKIFYVGQGSYYGEPNYNRAKTKHYQNKEWMKMVGDEKWTWKIIREGLTKSEADEDETILIKIYGRICDDGILINKSIGGSANRGVKNKISWIKGKHLNEEYKKKISESLKGRQPWNKGLTKDSDDRVRKYSDIRKGQCRTIEQRKLISKRTKEAIERKNKSNT